VYFITKNKNDLFSPPFPPFSPLAGAVEGCGGGGGGRAEIEGTKKLFI
jgi:hypothetical protein